MTGEPTGWARAQLSALLAETIGGVWGSEPGADEVDVKVIRVTEMHRDGTLDPATAARRSISRSQLQSRELRYGDLLLEKSGGGPTRPVGRVGMVRALEGTSVCANFMQLLRADERVVTPAYLEMLLRGFHVAGGTAPLQTATTNIRNLKMKDYLAQPHPVPPLAEQVRIVAAIEEAFSLLDAGESGLHATRTRLRRMRDAVLTAAVTGQLVPQDPTDTPAHALLGAIGVQPSVQDALPTLPTNWAWTNVGQILSQPLANGRSVPTRDEGFPVLRLTCLRGDGIDLSQRKGGDWEAKDAGPFLVQRGDFLVSRGNGSLGLVGRGGLVDEDPDPVAYPDTLIRVRVEPSVAIPRLLSIWWKSRTVRDQVESQARTTAGIYKINQSMIQGIQLPVPPVPEQVRIVAEVERQFSFIEAAERAVDATLVRSAGLRRSVLKAAFEGRLVTQDPSDEPASMLLERIAAERTADPKKASRRGRAKVEAS